MERVVVIGAGAAGLSAAAMLRRRGLAPVVLEEADVGASWKRRYDRLRLNSTRLLSSLPGRLMPRRKGRWVHRDDYVSYLRGYARHHRLDVRCGVRVERIDGERGAFTLTTSGGPVATRVVVVATGHDRTPHRPVWSGRETFPGQLMHAAEYLRPEPFKGRHVLVVGAGNSAMEIALDIREGGASTVQLAVRTPPILLAHEWHGLPATWFGLLGQPLPSRARDIGTRLLSRAMFGDLTPVGLPAPRRGMSEQLALGRLPTIDKGTVAAIERGLVDVVAGVERFEGAEVVLADGRRLSPDVVLAATAYRPGLEPLVGHLGALDEDGHPCPGAVRGLHFIGYRVPLPGPLAQYWTDAPRLARQIARELALSKDQ